MLVELKIPENVGFVARVAKNFGIKDLWLYRCNVSEESYYTAAHAKDLLEKARIVEDLSFLDSMNFVIGTTGVESFSVARRPVLTPEKARRFAHGEVAVLFGREDYGLLESELEMCHAVVRIPTSEEYPIMNVSHAAAIVLYILSKKRVEKDVRFATTRDIEVVLENARRMLELAEFPKHRMRRTIVTLRRLLARSKPREEEIKAVNAIFRKTAAYIERLRG